MGGVGQGWTRRRQGTGDELATTLLTGALEAFVLDREVSLWYACKAKTASPHQRVGQVAVNNFAMLLKNFGVGHLRYVPSFRRPSHEGVPEVEDGSAVRSPKDTRVLVLSSEDGAPACSAFIKISS